MKTLLDTLYNRLDHRHKRHPGCLEKQEQQGQHHGHGWHGRVFLLVWRPASL